MTVKQSRTDAGWRGGTADEQLNAGTTRLPYDEWSHGHAVRPSPLAVTSRRS